MISCRRPGGHCSSSPLGQTVPMTAWHVGDSGVVVLSDGRLVRGRGLRAGLPPGAAEPEVGLYLTSTPHREQGWESQWVRWPDFRLPSSPSVAIAALRELLERAADSRVEVACGGGRGRTGTAIALLARMAGVPAADAVAWTRAHYRAGAVETPWQRRFVRLADLDHH